ncbi:hypothetical protein Tco_0965261 [Tanacetum coccineum]
MEAAVQQYHVDKQCFEIQKKQFLIENDQLLDQIISQDIANIVVNSLMDINTSVNVISSTAMNDSVNYVEICNKCLKLEAEFIKQHNMEEVFVIIALKNDLRKIKGKDIVDNAAQVSKASTIAPGMYKLDPFLGYVRDTFLDIHKPSEKLVTVTPINKKKTVRGDGSSKNYKIFTEMLRDFDRHDVEELYRLVKERYRASSPEGYDLMLWGDLHTMFEPNEDDELWKNQHQYNLLSWSLYDFCGIHMLLMENGMAIHMLTEKKYPLSQEMISKMLKKRLEVDHESTQAIELLRFIRSQVQK